MADSKEFDIREHVNVILRRRWYFMVPFSLIVTVSSIVTFLIPKTYRSSATIVIRQKRDPLGVAHISINKIPALTKLVKSRENLENIIKKVGLDKNVVDPIQYETLIKYVAGNLKVRSRGSSLSVTFTGRSPKLCMQIVNLVSGIFSEQDVKVESKYDRSIDYIERQSKVYERKVLEASELIRQFREIHMDQLPESDSINKELAKESRAGLEKVEEKIDGIKGAILGFEEKLTAEPETLDSFTSERSKDKKLTPLEVKLKGLNGELESLLVTYTEKYPSVKQVKDEIDLVKAQIQESYAEEKKVIRSVDSQEDALSLHVTAVNPVFVSVNKQLVDAKRKLITLKEERNEYLENISQSEENLRAVPRHEQELKTLAATFKTYQGVYRGLQRNLQESKLRREMEAWGGGTYFKVVNPASLPLHPIAPQMWKMITIGVILGGLIGITAAFWAELMDHSIRDLETAKSYFSVPILAAIPKVYVEVEIIRKRRLNMFLFVIGSFYVIFIVILITREILLQIAPDILEFQTYKEIINQFLQTLGISPLS